MVSNLCSTALFCPDIGEIQSLLIGNNDKLLKGKFEKTVDWERRRLHVLEDIHLANGKNLGGEMIFLYEQGTGSLTNHDASYDADTEMWTFPLTFRNVRSNTCVPMFGPKSGGVFCLVVPQDLANINVAHVSMPPSVAAANDGKIQLAFIGRLTAPYIWTGDYSVRDILTGLHFDLNEVVCLNPKTGQRWKVNYVNPQSEEKSSAPGVVFVAPSQPPTRRTFEEVESQEVERKATEVSVGESVSLARNTFSTIANTVVTKRISLLSNYASKSLGDLASPEKLQIRIQRLLDYEKDFKRVLQSNPLQQITFSSGPDVSKRGNAEILNLRGFYRISALRLMQFDFTYINEDGAWKLDDFTIKTGP
ncbi:MAG: hypothetical protein ACMG5Z_05275 [Luteimonas sp.]